MRAPSRYPTLLAAAALALALGACGSPPPTGGQPPSATPAPTAGAAPSTAAAGALLWPVTSREQAATLQQQVDAGSQPWLLDPSEVAAGYASAVYGWRSAQPGAPDGGVVEVSDAQGGRATVTLIQPGRTGPGGIWVVTAERRN